MRLPDTSGYNREGACALMERLRAGETLLVQGAMGTELALEAGAADVPAAFWNIAEPQIVAFLHRSYVQAGADVAVSNTFQASAPALERDGIRASVGEVNDAAVRAARSAQPAHVLGSMGACGLDCVAEDTPAFRAARAAYREQAYALLAAGADALLLETFTSLHELAPALRGAFDVADGMPVFASFAVDAQGDLLGDRLPIEAAILLAEKRGCAVVGVNCCSLEEAAGLAERMVAAARMPVMLRPSAGIPSVAEGGMPVYPDMDEAFARAARAWRDEGVALVGSCCGTRSLTTCAMRLALDE